MGSLCIPVLNRSDLLSRCVRSVDYPFGVLHVINNGDDEEVIKTVSAIKERKFSNHSLFGEVKVERFKNLGVAASWNRFMSVTPGPWLISNNDIQFLPGNLKKLTEVLESNLDAAVILCASQFAAFYITDVARKKVGLFDENFYPAYFEDMDYVRRVGLVGAKMIYVDEVKPVHGEAPYWGESTVRASQDLHKKRLITTDNLGKYYREKWGGDPGKEKYCRPFNQDVTTDFWSLDLELRKKNSLF